MRGGLHGGLGLAAARYGRIMSAPPSPDAAAAAALAAWHARVSAWRESRPPVPGPRAPGPSEHARLWRLCLPWPPSALARLVPTPGHPIYRLISLRPPPELRIAVPLWGPRLPSGEREIVDIALWSGVPGGRWLVPSGLIAATPAARLSGKGSPCKDLDAYLQCDPAAAWICRT